MSSASRSEVAHAWTPSIHLGRSSYQPRSYRLQNIVWLDPLPEARQRKVISFLALLTTFPDPLHFGRLPSLVVATASDGIASTLHVASLWTRAAAAFILANVMIAWELFTTSTSLVEKPLMESSVRLLRRVGIPALRFREQMV